ncbi:MAG: MoaD/ThiS family protein [Pseudomonadota bacterium]|nr:MoaD/ThiS family protein [Pseudomonadota bacterium]
MTGGGQRFGVRVLYFASLRDAAGIDGESLPAQGDLRSLYQGCRERHGFSLPVDRLRVAVDGAFAHWQDPVQPGTEIAFIPPVSGG